MARGAYFNPDIDPRLLKAIEANSTFGKYGTRMTSGYRPGDKRQHGRHNAVDLELLDESGKALDNYQSPDTFAAYQQYANQVYKWAEQNDPQLAKQLRWGGYFSGGKDRYGALDLMHFDTAGEQIGMAGGSWQGGLTPDQAKIWGLQAGGGVDTEAMAAAGYSPEQIRKAFLASISSTESPGYDVMYGGNKFTDFSRHPHASQTANGVSSDAAGKYQFLGSTWDEQAKKYGYKDFSAETQDTAAWNYANDIYKTKTGGSLEEALASNDPARVNAAASILNKTWTSLPGGAEQSKGYGDKTFADVYSANLGAAPTATPATDTPVAGAFPPPPSTKKELTPWQKFGKGFGKGLGTATAPGVVASGVSDQPRAVLAANEPTTYDSTGSQAAEMKRQSLAQIMARLNSGKLV